MTQKKRFLCTVAYIMCITDRFLSHFALHQIIRRCKSCDPEYRESPKIPIQLRLEFATQKMRKILTNAVDEIEVIVSARSDLFRKNQDFVEKRSNVFSTRRREIFTNP